jgi:hypothetical protein
MDYNLAHYSLSDKFLYSPPSRHSAAAPALVRRRSLPGEGGGPAGNVGAAVNELVRRRWIRRRRTRPACNYSVCHKFQSFIAFRRRDHSLESAASIAGHSNVRSGVILVADLILCPTAVAEAPRQGNVGPPNTRGIYLFKRLKLMTIAIDRRLLTVAPASRRQIVQSTIRNPQSEIERPGRPAGAEKAHLTDPIRLFCLKPALPTAARYWEHRPCALSRRSRRRSRPVAA